MNLFHGSDFLRCSEQFHYVKSTVVWTTKVQIDKEQLQKFQSKISVMLTSTFKEKPHFHLIPSC